MPALSISQRLNAERIVVLGWTRAILLQLAHPLVAAGVAEHSSFRSGRVHALLRLHHTIRSMLALAFGDAAGRLAALETIRAIHRRVHGRLHTPAGIFPAGTPYSAEDPALVLWVHATLLESIPLTYQLLVSPLTDGDKDAYCEQAAAVAIDLGARDDEVPRTWARCREYLDRMYASGAIAVSPEARELAAHVVSPPLAWLVAPAAWTTRLMAVGLLPPDLRRQYGFPWSSGRTAALQRTSAMIRAGRRIMPDAIALWPEAKRVSSPSA